VLYVVETVRLFESCVVKVVKGKSLCCKSCKVLKCVAIVETVVCVVYVLKVYGEGY
jgi:hypothetical protein